MAKNPKPGFNVTIPAPPKPKPKHVTKNDAYYWNKLTRAYGKSNPGLIQYKQDIIDASRRYGIHDYIYLAAVLLASGGVQNPERVIAVAKQLQAGVGIPGLVQGAKTYLPKGYNVSVNPSIWNKVQASQTRKQIQLPGQESAQWNALFKYYLGRNASKSEVQFLLGKQWSQYQTMNWLSKKPGFFKSPGYKEDSAKYLAEWQRVMGTDPTLKAPKALLRKAVAGGWSTDHLYEEIRKLPQYERGVEFKQVSDALTKPYEAIYGGSATAEAQKSIKAAAKLGWQPEQYADWLRNQPEYAFSSEQRSNLAQGDAWWGAASGFTPYTGTEPIPGQKPTPAPGTTTTPPAPPKPKPKPPVQRPPATLRQQP